MTEGRNESAAAGVKTIGELEQRVKALEARFAKMDEPRSGRGLKVNPAVIAGVDTSLSG
jgi:hypothetical protein